LVHGPTPIHTLRSGEKHKLWIKRDDCTGLALGGNKTRKLEFTIGQAIAEGATALVTASGIQSNHVRQTAAAAARSGLAFHPIVFAPLPRFGIGHLNSGNLLLDGLLGAKLHVAESEADLDAKVSDVIESLTREGHRVFFIPLGASDGVGSLGYVAAALEIVDQIRAQGLSTSHVFTATGSGGTHAGLIAGLRLAGSSIQVVGISVSEPTDAKIKRVGQALSQIAVRLGIEAPPWAASDILVLDRYAGAGYAFPTAEADEWVRSVARNDGILLDPVYTGKAFAGAMDLLDAEALGKVADPLFLHTGGIPVLFAEPTSLWDALKETPGLDLLQARIV
jgi:D-cysteine desulfhydrase family pyridoxal phosphate-dependent enzyme